MRDNTSNHTEGSAVREKKKPDHRQTEAQRQKKIGPAIRQWKYSHRDKKGLFILSDRGKQSQWKKKDQSYSQVEGSSQRENDYVLKKWN